MASIERNLHEIRQKLGRTTLVVVTKNRSVEEVRKVYDCGERIFGENRVQALVARMEDFPRDIQWHLIGHLQTNKVKYIAPFVSMIHSIDGEKLLDEVNRQAAKNNRVIPCLLQLYVAKEESKFGFSAEELEAYLQSGNWKNLTHIRICGIMAMASFTENTDQVHREFAQAKSFFDHAKNTYFTGNSDFSELSIGMSGDYEIALEHGSTMVRIGSRIFE